MNEIIDNPGQVYMADEINLKMTQPVDPFTDHLVLGIASAIGLLVLVGSVISCICCARGNSHSRYRNASSSGSIRDTVQLEDLLSKPTLADPESVFSEFLLDATISEDCSSQIAVTVDETTQNTIASSALDSYDESRRKSSDKGGSKKYRKESRKKSKVEFNNMGSNNKSIYKKNSCNNQTLQNDLSYVSSKSKKVQNKLDYYDKKATETLQQENDMKNEKSTNMDKEQELADGTSKTHQQHQQRKSSLEILDTNRHSSGSFTSSARGSVCHDIGMPANAFKLHRPSIYPRMDCGSCTEGRRDDAEDNLCSLPDVLESSVDSKDVLIQNEDYLKITLDNVPSHNQGSLHTAEKTETTCCDGPNPNNVALRSLGQKEKEKDFYNRNQSHCLQKSYSVDRTFSDNQKGGKLPERISLNLKIDFHFPNQGQPQRDGPIPIVVCSPIAFNNKCNIYNTDIPIVPKSDDEQENTTCCDTAKTQDTIEQDKVLKLKIHQNTQYAAISKSSNTHDFLVSRDSESTTSAENMKRNLIKSTPLQLTSRLPFWVKNRLSEPVEFCNWIEKISNSPRLKRRSFTIADFKSLKFSSFTTMNNENSTTDSTQVENSAKLSEQTQRISTNAGDADNDLQMSSGVPGIIEDKSNHEIGVSAEKNIMIPCSESNDVNDEMFIAENIASTSMQLETDIQTNSARSEPMSDTADLKNTELTEEPSTLDRMSRDYEIPTLVFSKSEVKSDQNGDKSSNMNSYNNSDEESDYTESDIAFDNGENLMIKCVNDKMCEEKHMNERSRDANTSGCFDEVNVDNLANAMKIEYDKSVPYKQEHLKPRMKRQNTDRSSMVRSNSLGTIPVIPFVPSLIVTSADGIEIGSNQTFPKSLRHKHLPDNADMIYDDATDSNSSQTCPMAWEDVSTSADNTIDHDNLGDDVIMCDEHGEIVNSQTYPKITKRNVESSNTLTNTEMRYSQTYPKASRLKPRLGDSTIQGNVIEVGSVETYPKSCNHKAKINDTRREDCVTETGCHEILVWSTHQKARSADVTMDRDVTEEGCDQDCSQYIDCKASSADTTMDTNVASDDSDYDNPWDSLENAVKRASMKCHKRPSVAASKAREFMLKSAEDLGRLMEIAEKRRKERLNSTKSTCDDMDSDNNSSPVFSRVSPFRHTVKGVMFTQRGFKEELGGIPARGKPGSKSLRVSKDDSVHNMTEADKTKLNSKSWKFYSPESKKKLKKRL